MFVVGPGFDSTSPAFVRSRANQAAAGSEGWLAQKNGIALWGQGLCGPNLCICCFLLNFYVIKFFLLKKNVCSIPTSCRLCLLGTPPPTSTPSSDQTGDDSTFNVLQLNANGIGNTLTELGVVMKNNKVEVIQESKLTSKSRTTPHSVNNVLMARAEDCSSSFIDL